MVGDSLGTSCHCFKTAMEIQPKFPRVISKHESVAVTLGSSEVAAGFLGSYSAHEQLMPHKVGPRGLLMLHGITPDL